MGPKTPLTSGQLSRRHRRRHRNQRADFDRKAGSAQWLETHVWHAKRMHMATLWGYRLAVQRCDKSARASFRFLRRDAVVHDASYYECVEVAALADTLLAGLAQITYPPIVALTPSAEATVLVHAPGAMQDCAGRARLLFSDAAGSVTTWAFVHPAHTAAVAAAFTAVFGAAVLVRRRELCRIELRGPRSAALLCHALQPDGGATSKAQLAVWHLFPHLAAASTAPGSVLGLTIVDPRLQSPRRVAPVPAPSLALLDLCAKVHSRSACSL